MALFTIRPSRRTTVARAATAEEALRRFGKSPNPLHILQALIDSAPGPTSRRENIDLAVLLQAARTALEQAKAHAEETKAFESQDPV